MEAQAYQAAGSQICAMHMRHGDAAILKNIFTMLHLNLERHLHTLTFRAVFKRHHDIMGHLKTQQV